MEGQPKTALLSVSDKTGIVEFARKLRKRGWRILATNGTAEKLRSDGIAVKYVTDLTGPELLGGLVKTLSRKLFTAIMATDCPKDRKELAKLGIFRIDLVCVNFYQLKKKTDDPDHTYAYVIKNIDVGGPALLAAAVKGGCVAICDPTQMKRVIDWLDEDCPEADKFLNTLVVEALRKLSEHHTLVADYFEQSLG